MAMKDAHAALSNQPLEATNIVGFALIYLDPPRHGLQPRSCRDLLDRLLCQIEH